MLATETTVITLNGQDYELPNGISPVNKDGLFLVDWNLIEIAKEPKNITPETAFKFFNPRHLGQYEIEKDGELFKGQGFNREEMRALMDDVIQNGLVYPLQTYFIVTEDGQIKVRVHDGERRWRCLDRMIERDVQAWSRADQRFMSAREVYNSVMCRVSVMTEEEALMRACAVS